MADYARHMGAKIYNASIKFGIDGDERVSLK